MNYSALKYQYKRETIIYTYKLGQMMETPRLYYLIWLCNIILGNLPQKWNHYLTSKLIPENLLNVFESTL